ncbi:hypothetical protein AAF712_013947 [Marasmius tenuissimus]|uniref:Uncharacterized protein n=1 Tax=Marasmius tenuissimus TaxID=585030 RepID=A0ABR2ZDA0_9AGAR
MAQFDGYITVAIETVQWTKGNVCTKSSSPFSFIRRCICLQYSMYDPRKFVSIGLFLNQVSMDHSQIPLDEHKASRLEQERKNEDVGAGKEEGKIKDELSGSLAFASSAADYLIKFLLLPPDANVAQHQLHDEDHDLFCLGYQSRSASCITSAIAFVKDKVKDPPPPVRGSEQFRHLSLPLPFYPCKALEAFVPSAYDIAEAVLAVVKIRLLEAQGRVGDQAEPA